MSQPKSGAGIGRRIGRMVAGAVFAAVFLAALTLSIVQVGNDVGNRRQSLLNTGYTLAAAVADAVVEHDRSKAFETLGAVSRIPGLLMVSLTDASGGTLANLGQATILQDDLASMDGSNLSFLFRGTMPVAVDIVKGGQRVGRLVLLADISGARSDFLLTILRTLAAALIAAIAGTLISMPLQRRIVSPVMALTEKISSIRKSKNYAANVEVKEDIGEVGVLLEAFNGLMADIRFRDQSLQKLAYFDPLTGLPNRSSLLNEIAMTRNEDAAFAVFSVHNYQSVTNAFGQTIGDGILMSVAAALRENAEGAGIFRIGTHEFAVLLPAGKADNDVERSIARFFAAFIRPLKIQRSEVKIHMNCGFVHAGPHASDAINGANLLRCALLALDEASKRGPNHCVRYHQEMSEKAQIESQLAQELRLAISMRQLETHFQPQLEIATGEISGFEALARWHHPVRGIVPPAVFVPVAETHGLIVELGDLILDEGCRSAAAWMCATGIERTVSVNVSAAQFLEIGFAAKVLGTAERHGLPPRLLCLEVTESIFIGSGLSEIRNTLRTLSGHGVKLALDDFGTGYSSLGYLAKLPFNILKIDRSFVANAQHSERRKAMLSAIIGMSHSVGLEVVAEGAETAEEIALLENLGADRIQGYGVARPMPAEAAREFAASWAQQRQLPLPSPSRNRQAK